jgi:hypothetical protein
MVHQPSDSDHHCDASVTSVTAKVPGKLSHRALFYELSGSKFRCRCVKRALTRSSRIPTFIDREARIVAIPQIILGLPGPPRATPTRSKDMPDIPLRQPTGTSIWKLWQRVSPPFPYPERTPIIKPKPMPIFR